MEAWHSCSSVNFFFLILCPKFQFMSTVLKGAKWNKNQGPSGLVCYYFSIWKANFFLRGDFSRENELEVVKKHEYFGTYRKVYRSGILSPPDLILNLKCRHESIFCSIQLEQETAWKAPETFFGHQFSSTRVIYPVCTTVDKPVLTQLMRSKSQRENFHWASKCGQIPSRYLIFTDSHSTGITTGIGRERMVIRTSQVRYQKDGRVSVWWALSWQRRSCGTLKISNYRNSQNFCCVCVLHASYLCYHINMISLFGWWLLHFEYLSSTVTKHL